MVTEPTVPPKMDESFRSPNVGQPPPGKIVEVWHGGGCIKGYKRDGSWHTEDGTSITVEGWRLIGAKPPPDKPAAEPLAAPKVDHKPATHGAAHAPRHR